MSWSALMSRSARACRSISASTEAVLRKDYTAPPGLARGCISAPARHAPSSAQDVHLPDIHRLRVIDMWQIAALFHQRPNQASGLGSSREAVPALRPTPAGMTERRSRAANYGNPAYTASRPKADSSFLGTCLSGRRVECTPLDGLHCHIVHSADGGVSRVAVAYFDFGWLENATERAVI